MSDPRFNDKPTEETTGEDNTIRPDAPAETHGATEDQVVHVDGPAKGSSDEGGTQDVGIDPEDEITPG